MSIMRLAASVLVLALAQSQVRAGGSEGFGYVGPAGIKALGLEVPAVGEAVADIQDTRHYGGREGWRGEEVRGMAHRLDNACRQARENYRREKPGNFFDKISWRAAYSSLEELQESSEHFHRQVESRWQDPGHTRADYDRLASVYGGAAGNVPGAYHFGSIKSEWRQIESAMHDLDQAYRWSRPGGRWRWENVKPLAHEVDQAAEHVHREAERQAHHGDYWEQRALSDLHALAEAAEHFHTQVERYRQDPGHTRSDFYKLLSACRRAESSFDNAHAFHHVREDFHRVRRLIGELEDAYRDSDHGHGGH